MLSAQSLMHVRYYSAKDGLSQNTVTDFLQDDKGYIWMSTWNGLEKFDGYTFQNYKSYPTDDSRLEYNRIQQIVEAKKGIYGVLLIIICFICLILRLKLS